MADVSKLMEGRSLTTDAKKAFKPTAPANVVRPKPVKVPEATSASSNGAKGKDSK